MFNFDWLLGKQAETGQMGMGSDAASLSYMQENPARGWQDLVENKNFLRFLAQSGKQMGSGASFAEALGGSTDEWIRSKAFQDARAKDIDRQQAMMERIFGEGARPMRGTAPGMAPVQKPTANTMIESLRADPTGRKVLGPADDPNTVDSIKITDKNITYTMPNPDQTKPEYLKEQRPAEADRGYNLPDFV